MYDLHKQIARELVENNPALLTLENLDKLIEEIEKAVQDMSAYQEIKHQRYRERYCEMQERGPNELDAIPF